MSDFRVTLYVNSPNSFMTLGERMDYLEKFINSTLMEGKETKHDVINYVTVVHGHYIKD